MKRLAVGLNAAIFAVTDDQPRVLTVEDPRPEAAAGSAGEPALPFGRLDPEGDRTLELGLRGWVREQTGLELGYVEQLYTFGDRDRHLGGDDDCSRVLSIAYLALVREHDSPSLDEAHWRDVYELLPWEDWRSGRPAVIARFLSPRLREWATRGADRSRRSGASGSRSRSGSAARAGTRSACSTATSCSTRRACCAKRGATSSRTARRGASRRRRPTAGARLGRSMVLDHRRIVATALGRLRGKLKYRPVVFELLPPFFTLLQLQRVVEALAGIRLHKQNFRRLVETAGLVEGTRPGGHPDRRASGGAVRVPARGAARAAGAGRGPARRAGLTGAGTLRASPSIDSPYTHA